MTSHNRSATITTDEMSTLQTRDQSEHQNGQARNGVPDRPAHKQAQKRNGARDGEAWRETQEESGIRFKVAVDLTAESPEAIISGCIWILRKNGYSVTKPTGRWESVTQLKRRLGVHSETIRKAIASPGCPNVLVDRGNNRVKAVMSNPDFDAFVLRNKRHV